jgi:hypothetical protein
MVGQLHGKHLKELYPEVIIGSQVGHLHAKNSFKKESAQSLVFIVAIITDLIFNFEGTHGI